MTSLRERDVHAVLRLVGDVHHADDLDDFRAMLLASLPELVPTDYVSYNEASADGVGVAIVAPDLPEWAFAAWAKWGAQNPLIQRHLRTHDGRAYRFSDVITRDELRALELYTELYARFGLEHQLAFCLPSPMTRLIGIALSRGGKDFTERDRAVINLARPHLIQAYRNVELRRRSAALIEAVRGGLDDAQQAMVLVERGGRDIVFASEPARRLLRAATGASVADGGPLPPDVTAWMRNGSGVPLVLGGRRPLAVRLLPGAADEPDVLVLEPGMRTVGASVLRGLGLTPREAEVLHLIVRGHANDEIAHELSISPRTVHKHVEHVFAKLGVGSRVEAVATVWAAVGLDG